MNPNERLRKLENFSRTRPGNHSRDQDPGGFRGRSRDRNPNFIRPTTFLEDELVNAMMNARMIQSFGPEYATFADRGGRYSRCISQLEGLGSSESLILNIEYPAQPESDWLRQELENVKQKKKAKTKNNEVVIEAPKPLSETKFVLPSLMEEVERNPNIVSPRQKAISGWFESGMKNELEKRRQCSSEKSVKDPALNSLRQKYNLQHSVQDVVDEVKKPESNTNVNLQISEAISKFANSKSNCSCHKVLDSVDKL